MLDRVVGNIGRKPLKVFVQVNTSGEDCKNLEFLLQHLSQMFSYFHFS